MRTYPLWLMLAVAAASSGSALATAASGGAGIDYPSIWACDRSKFNWYCDLEPETPGSATEPVEPKQAKTREEQALERRDVGHDLVTIVAVGEQDAGGAGVAGFQALDGGEGGGGGMGFAAGSDGGPHAFGELLFEGFVFLFEGVRLGLAAGDLAFEEVVGFLFFEHFRHETADLGVVEGDRVVVPLDADGGAAFAGADLLFAEDRWAEEQKRGEGDGQPVHGMGSVLAGGGVDGVAVALDAEDIDALDQGAVAARIIHAEAAQPRIEIDV